MMFDILRRSALTVVIVGSALVFVAYAAVLPQSPDATVLAPGTVDPGPARRS